MTRASARASGLVTPTPLQPLLNALLRVGAGLVLQLAMLVCRKPTPAAPKCDVRDEQKPDVDPSREIQEPKSVRLQTDNLSSTSNPLPAHPDESRDPGQAVRLVLPWSFKPMLFSGRFLAPDFRQDERALGFCWRQRSGIQRAPN